MLNWEVIIHSYLLWSQKFQIASDAIPFLVVVLYLMTLVGLERWMRFRKKFELGYLLFIHNLFMSGSSLVISFGVIHRIVNIVIEFGIFPVYCGVNEEIDDLLFFWMKMFYIMKYLELFDTVFLILKKRKVIFLHWYHHCNVVLVVWLAIRDQIVMGFITCLTNSIVHVFMYYYYALKTRGISIWWRRYLTQMQIFQFVIDVSTSLFYAYFYWTDVSCRGSIRSWLFANFVGSSLFFLFLRFYFQQYRHKKNDENRFSQNNGDKQDIKKEVRSSDSSKESSLDKIYEESFKKNA